MQHENRAIFSLARHLGKRWIGKAIPNGIAALLYGTEPSFKPFFVAKPVPPVSRPGAPAPNICYCVRRVRTMKTERIGMREFRENLAGYLESGKPLAITRHGETLGFYIPAQKRSRKAAVEAMRAAAKDLDAMIANWGASEDELMEEYKEIRQASRAKKRNTK